MVFLFTNKIISKCRNCDNVLNFQFNNFIQNPPWIFIQTKESEIFGHELPKKISYWIQELFTFKCNHSFRKSF